MVSKALLPPPYHHRQENPRDFKEIIRWISNVITLFEVIEDQDGKQKISSKGISKKKFN